MVGGSGVLAKDKDSFQVRVFIWHSKAVVYNGISCQTEADSMCNWRFCQTAFKVAVIWEDP